jgi:hypothetical protein
MDTTDYDKSVRFFQTGLYEPVKNGELIVGRNRRTNEAVLATKSDFGEVDYLNGKLEAKRLGLNGVGTVICAGFVCYLILGVSYVELNNNHYNGSRNQGSLF